jgi:fucose 4-O-acetylase-like acetyltransferase
VTRLPFIDWMKATGMGLIVFGHVVGGVSNMLTPPIYQKQLGVAFFLFVAGFTLARDARPARHIVINRLFEIVFVGALFAVLSTVVSLATGGGGQLSNYLPLLLGANVALDHFPANPTTWYIGTYIHVILLWVLVGRVVRPSGALLAACVLVEVVARAALWTSAGGFIAYMAVTNWLTVFLLGVYAGQRPDGTRYPAWTTAAAFGAVALPLALGGVRPFDEDFPFRSLPAAGALAPLVSSVGVSLLYAGATWLMFRAASGLGRSRAVEFLSAQTLIIFVAHMPLYYALMRVIGDWPRGARAVPLMLLCYPGLAVAGTWLYQGLRPHRWRARLLQRAG